MVIAVGFAAIAKSSTLKVCGEELERMKLESPLYEATMEYVPPVRELGL